MPTFGVSRAFTPLFTPHPQVAMSPLAGRQMAFVMYAERLQQNEDEQCARQTAMETKEAASCNNMGTVSEDTYLMFLDSYLHRTLAKLGIMDSELSKCLRKEFSTVRDISMMIFPSLNFSLVHIVHESLGCLRSRSCPLFSTTMIILDCCRLGSLDGLQTWSSKMRNVNVYGKNA